MTALADIPLKTIRGADASLGDYAGKVLLVVNVASKCGLTPQYEGLESLYGKYRDQGLVVLGFPCDQFGHQEPGDEEEIATFCERNFGVTFPLFSKVDVNGDAAHPLFTWLRSEKGGLLGGLGSNRVKWNFTKFLVGKDGRVIARYAPTTKPEKIADDLERALTS